MQGKSTHSQKNSIIFYDIIDELMSYFVSYTRHGMLFLIDATSESNYFFAPLGHGPQECRKTLFNLWV